MDDHSDRRESMRNPRTLIKAAGYISSRMKSDGRAMSFGGRTREWNIVARANATWLNVYTIVCDVPEEPGVRARLLEATMRMNRNMLVSKFVVGDQTLALELDYRMEYIDSDVLRELVSLMYANAEKHYPKLFRIAAGDDVLEALDDPSLIPAP